MPKKNNDNGHSFHFIAELATAARGDTQAGVEHVQNYLTRFGYLEEGTYAGDNIDDETSSALSKYQERNDVPVTGEFDKPTQKRMTQARCAFPDMRDGIDFATLCAWTKRNLRVAYETPTSDCAGEFTAVRKSLATWSAAVPLTFTEVATNQSPDILVDWRPSNDPDHSMVGGVLAHADFPPGCSIVTNGLPKPVHFDDSEHLWSIGAVEGAFDVETVALHEMGHILGLAHSSVAGSVMFPTVSSNHTKRTLTADDLAGIRALYPHQSNWRWCSKCQGMWFAGNNTAGKCPAGGGHEKAASGNYAHMHGAANAAGQQSNWRFCSKCQGMWFGGNAGGKCPSDNASHTKVGSGNYSVCHGGA